MDSLSSWMFIAGGMILGWAMVFLASGDMANGIWQLACAATTIAMAIWVKRTNAKAKR